MKLSAADISSEKAHRYALTTVQQARLRGLDMKDVGTSLMVESVKLLFPGDLLGATPYETSMKALQLSRTFHDWIVAKLEKEREAQ